MSEAELNLVAKDIHAIINGTKQQDELKPILDKLETFKVASEVLNNSRLGAHLNSLRKKLTDEKLARRVKILIKSWQPASSPGSIGSSSRKTKSTSSPGNESDAKRLKSSTSSPQKPDNDVVVKTEKPSTSSRAPPPKKYDLKMPADEVRARNVTILKTSLTFTDVPDGSQHPDDVAIRIEAAIFDVFNNTSKEYLSCIRSRVFNLRDKKNPALRENILTGQLSPERFARMTADDMASNEMKKMREEFTQEGINEHQMAVTEGTPTDMFKCGKCHQNNCTYNQLQTRSADEPMTTFVFCRSCGNRWKFC